MAANCGSRRGHLRYALNTSTVRGQNLGILEEVELAARTGYDGIEPWLEELEAYERDGGSLGDLGKRIRDLGLEVIGAIAFPRWADPDEAARRQALEDVQRDMEKVLEIGGQRIAAPPGRGIVGVTLPEAAARYRDFLGVGKAMGVIPAVEVWGFSPWLSRLSDAAYIVTESGDPRASMILDSYHLYKGGGGMGGVRLLHGDSIGVFHINDYPADPPREEIEDRHRVFPGDGVAPLSRLFRDLDAIGYRGMLSLELFNPAYYERDAGSVAREGLEKTRAAVAAALSR